MEMEAQIMILTIKETIMKNMNEYWTPSFLKFIIMMKTQIVWNKKMVIYELDILI